MRSDGRPTPRPGGATALIIAGTRVRDKSICAQAPRAAWGPSFADLPSTLAYVLAHMARAAMRPMDYPPSCAEIAGRQLQVRQE